ncbi:hypothetical protein PG995_011673 [Apiospora arundinis]
MAYIYQTPIWALPNYQFRYPEYFQQQQQQQQQYELEQESNRAAWEAYVDSLSKQLYGDNHTQCHHYRFPHPDQRPRPSGPSPPVEQQEQVPCEGEFRRRPQLSFEDMVMDHLSKLVRQNQMIRLQLEQLNAVVSTLAPADCDCDCDADPDVLAECDAPGWFHRSDGDEEEDSLERFQCNSCGSDHPHFAAAFAIPPLTTNEVEKNDEPTEEKGKAKGKEVKQEQQQEEELVVPSWVDEVERKVGSESELETSSGLGSSA